MKQKNKTLTLLFSIVLILLIQVVNFSIAYDPATNVVESDWLYVSAEDFVDTSPHDWENEITIDTGGIDLLEFNNLGIVAEATDDDQVVYKAEVKFGFEVTAHTSVDFRDFFPKLKLDAKYKERFFTVNHFYIWGDTVSAHNVEWNYVDYGATEQWHDYKGTIPITVGILETSGRSGTIELNGITFSTPEYKCETIKTEVERLRDGEVGEYEDIFTDVNDVKGGDVDFIVLDDFNEQQQKIIDYYRDYDLGWSAGDIEKGKTLQKYMIDGAQPGAEFINQYPMTEQFYTFGLSAKIQPEVYEYVQYNELRTANIVYFHDTIPFGGFAGDIKVVVNPQTLTRERVVGVHTTNAFLHWDLIVYVDIYATIQSTAELTESILNDPYLKSGDMVWDTSIVGTQHVEVPLAKGFDIMDWLWLIITIVILALGIYVFVQVGIPLIAKKKAADVVKSRL